jgi:hypothetical protein
MSAKRGRGVRGEGVAHVRRGIGTRGTRGVRRPARAGVRSWRRPSGRARPAPPLRTGEGMLGAGSRLWDARGRRSARPALRANGPGGRWHSAPHGASTPRTFGGARARAGSNAAGRLRYGARAAAPLRPLRDAVTAGCGSSLARNSARQACLLSRGGCRRPRSPSPPRSGRRRSRFPSRPRSGGEGPGVRGALTSGGASAFRGTRATGGVRRPASDVRLAPGFAVRVRRRRSGRSGDGVVAGWGSSLAGTSRTPP